MYPYFPKNGEDIFISVYRSLHYLSWWVHISLLYRHMDTPKLTIPLNLPLDIRKQHYSKNSYIYIYTHTHTHMSTPCVFTTSLYQILRYGFLVQMFYIIFSTNTYRKMESIFIFMIQIWFFPQLSPVVVDSPIFIS